MTRQSFWILIFINSLFWLGVTFYATGGATSAATATQENACLPLDLARPATEHILHATIDYAAKTVSVQQRTRYANRTDDILPELVFKVQPNRWADAFTLDAVTVGGHPHDDAQLDGTRLTVPLPQPLGLNCTVLVTLDFTLNVPPVGLTRRHRGYFGHSARQMNLGGWLPTVAPYIDGEWITHEPYHVGEQDALDVADWQITVRVVPEHSGLTIAAPNMGESLTADVSRYTHENAREIALSLSDRFALRSLRSATGVWLDVYTLEGTPNAAAHFADVALNSFDLFSGLFGAYGHERLAVVQGDFPDGMEFDGLIFVGDGWFSGWNGRVESYLTLITAHEVAHQWWYGRVGNSAALDPWLDEALATYSEYIYIENVHPELADWWWAFRVDPFSPTGFVDSPVYEFANAREYINAVYLRGARMLHAIRADLGDEAFFALLADYARSNTGGIATSADFWSLLTPEQLAATADTRARYLRQPDFQTGG